MIPLYKLIRNSIRQMIASVVVTELEAMLKQDVERSTLSTAG
ncbi:MAG: hypothetical protein ACTS73_07045 [Arsenophonus sp. NEOnobi-MAG3]